MALVVTPNGRYRIGIHHVGERFTVQRLTEVERTEAHPDGRIACFKVHDHSDDSMMTIDEEDADHLEVLWQSVATKQMAAVEIENHLTWVFDIQTPPKHVMSS
jgi:hypothetical protein